MKLGLCIGASLILSLTFYSSLSIKLFHRLFSSCTLDTHYFFLLLYPWVINKQSSYNRILTPSTIAPPLLLHQQFAMDAGTGVITLQQVPDGSRWQYHLKAGAEDRLGHVTLVPVSVFFICECLPFPFYFYVEERRSKTTKIKENSLLK